MILLAMACLMTMVHGLRVHASSTFFQLRGPSSLELFTGRNYSRPCIPATNNNKIDLLKQFTKLLLAHNLGVAFNPGSQERGLLWDKPRLEHLHPQVLHSQSRLGHHIPLMSVAEKLKSSSDQEIPPDSFPAYEKPSWFRFEVLHQSAKSRARVGRIHTPHGVIDTPGFVPVGTNAAIKFMTNEQARECGVQLQFANTYHLLVHPGIDVIEGAGGLHSFMQRPDFPLITDSGGFQVFSLATATADDAPELKRRASERNGQEGTLLRVNESGVVFRSYFDGKKISLSPESSVLAQKALGADIIIPLDELPPIGVSRERLAQSVAMSHRWEARSLRQHLADRRSQAMYAVVHGGIDRELRAHSVKYLSSLPFDGFAIGGSLGTNRTDLIDLLEFLMPQLPEDKPNHILGIADPESVLAAVPLGIDTCDSCFPTRVARHGSLFTRQGKINIKMAKHKDDYGPIDPEMPTIGYSRAYMHHLMRSYEPVFCSLASMHNIQFMTTLMAEMREKIYADEI